MMHKWRSVVVVFCCQVQCDGQCNEWQFSWKRCIVLTVCAVLASRYVFLWNGEGWGFEPWGLRWECLCLIQMRCVWYLCNLSSMSVWLAVRMSVLCGKDFNMDLSMQTCQSNSLMPAMLIGTIDLYHFMPLSVTFALAEGHRKAKNRKQNLLNLFCHTLVKWSGLNLNMVLKHFMLNILKLRSGEINCHRKKLQFYWLSKNFNIGVHSAVYTPIWFKLGVVIDTTGLYVLI